MPSTSKKQHNFMAAVAKNPAFAKKVGVKKSVGEEFLKADKGRKFEKDSKMKYSEGGAMKKEGRGMAKADMQKVAGKAVKSHEKRMHGMKKGGSVMPSKMGAVKTAAPSKDGVAIKGKTKGKMVSMRSGGSCK